MALRELIGMLFNACASLLIVCTLVLRSFMEKAQLPYCPCVGTANIVLFLVLGVVIKCKQLHLHLGLSQLKWVWMRGFFGCLSYVLIVVATALGAPLGDTSALGSVNVVVAALMGRAFLGEALHFLHYVALVCSVAGACLIAKPETLFGQAPAGRPVPWLGYAAAIGSGLAYGGLFISSRKSQKVSPIVMVSSVMFHEATAFWLVFASPLVDEPSLESVLAVPRLAVATQALMVALVLGAALSTTAGAQMCPVAVSSTIYTSVSMSCGYAAQMLLHAQAPEPLTLVGAALMLLAVVLIAAGRCRLPAQVDPSTCADAVQGPQQPSASLERESTHQTGMDDDEVESLASFIASEFSGVSPHENSTRQRRVRASGLVPPFHTIGIASA